MKEGVGTAARSAGKKDAGTSAFVGLFAVVACVAATPAPKAEPDFAWAYYNGTADSQRYAPLRQIDRANVRRLGPICETEVGEMGPFPSALLVADGAIFVTTPRSTVAIDATTCAVRWRHVVEIRNFDYGNSNRGPAYANGKVFRGTVDGNLVAIDARTGSELWKTKAGDPAKAEMLTAAPVATQDRVFVGTSGGDWGGQSRVMAFDANDGRELWRFNVVPMDGEPGADTWKVAPGSRRYGGAVWGAMTLDAATGELLVATGNPGPALAPGMRGGANLYTDSVVALDTGTGKLKWYIQAVANDALDYDLASAPMIYRDAAGRRRVAVGGKDGHLYLVDRDARRILEKVPVTTIENPEAIPTVEGVRVCPGAYGGVAWNGPALDPSTRTLFVGAVDQCQLYTTHGGNLKHPAAVFGTLTFNSTDPRDEIHGWVTAVDATTGRVKWRHRSTGPVMAGVTATAGGLVLTGDTYGNFLALDSATGEVLHQYPVNGAMAGGVVTYAAGGRQYVAYAVGGVVRGTFVKDVTPPRVVIATLTTPAMAVKRVVIPSLDPLPAPSHPGEATNARGAALYAQLCIVCHGPEGSGLTAPRLRGGNRADRRPVAEIIKDPKPAMARFYPGAIDDADVAQIAALVESWKE